jgi:phytoene synthase
MNLPGDALCASYAACRRRCRRAGSNFSAGFLLLPRAKRRAMDALYAFLRHTDDLVDNPQPAPLRTAALGQWRAALEDALQGRFDLPPDDPQHPSPPEDPQVQAGRILLPALADTVRQFAVPPQHLRAVIEGMEMDLKQRRYETFQELKQYCQRVASAVGLACIHIWGFRTPEALEPARKCGIALQLTNILRDLGDDAQQGRVYLPLSDLRECHYTVQDLLCNVADKRFERLMALQVERAERYYREGAALLDVLARDGQRIFGMTMAVYWALLRKIQRRPADVFAGRIRLGRAKKLQLAARWTLLPPRLAALL